ncbi:MAG: methyltransferase [Desulfobacteraceae bacterium]
MDKPEPVNPGNLLALSGAYWQTCALHAGVKLDLFSAIGRERCTGQELAEKLDLDARALFMLLNALCAMGLLTKKGDDYASTPEAYTLLSKASSGYVGHMVMHHHHLVESWANLDRAVATGEPVRNHADRDSDEYRESFLMGMFNIAMATAPQLVPTIDIKERKTLLDLGGGPGTYAIHFCMENPGLRAKVLDLPTTKPFAEKTIARFKQEEKVEFVGGDFLNDPIPGTHDVIWLSHILHGESPSDCRKIVNKAVFALNPGGMIIIHDFILDNDKTKPLFPALFSLNMLIGTQGGQAYSEAEIFSMLEDAGVGEIQRTSFRGPTDSGVITGVVPR